MKWICAMGLDFESGSSEPELKPMGNAIGEVHDQPPGSVDTSSVKS